MSIPTLVETETTTSFSVDHAFIVNKFSLCVATANGSGSQTSNILVIRSLFCF